MKQTGVEWLVQKFNQCEPMYSGIQSLEHKHYLDNLIEQAKAMEKEQIINAFNQSWHDRMNPYKTADKYYKETYESNT